MDDGSGRNLSGGALPVDSAAPLIKPNPLDPDRCLLRNVERDCATLRQQWACSCNLLRQSGGGRPVSHWRVRAYRNLLTAIVTSAIDDLVSEGKPEREPHKNSAAFLLLDDHSWLNELCWLLGVDFGWLRGKIRKRLAA